MDPVGISPHDPFKNARQMSRYAHSSNPPLHHHLHISSSIFALVPIIAMLSKLVILAFTLFFAVAPTFAGPTNITKADLSARGFMTGVQTGQGTWYQPGLGACGINNHDTDFIAAVSRRLFDAYPGYGGANPNKNPVCGRTVTARYKGKEVRVAIADRCEGCALTDLDFSPAAFAKLAGLGAGRLSGITWSWN